MPTSNGESIPKEDNVRVVIRCRPILDDLEQNEENVIKVSLWLLWVIFNNVLIIINRLTAILKVFKCLPRGNSPTIISLVLIQLKMNSTTKQPDTLLIVYFRGIMVGWGRLCDLRFAFLQYATIIL